MEHFPLRYPQLLHLLPGFESIPEARNITLHGVTFLGYPRTSYLAFCENPPVVTAAQPTMDSTVLVPAGLADLFKSAWPSAKLLPVDDPRALFIDVIGYLQSKNLIGRSSLLPATPSISPNAHVGEGVVIEADVQIDEGAVIGSGAVIKSGTWLKKGVIVGNNCVIGSTGIMAYVGNDGLRRGFPHLGGVVIDQETHIGASCVVVRGVLSSTVIGRKVIIGNLCNIGHGAVIGDDVWMSVGTLVGGHASIGAGATVAMGCTIRDNTSIGSRANVGMGSVVTKHVLPGASVFGNPARTHPSIAAGPAR